MRLADVMDELAQAVRAVPSLQGRVYAWPVQSISAPAAFVPFPEIEYDLAYGRGIDRIQLSLVVVVSAVDSRATRDAMLAYMSGDGDESIKAAIDDYGSYTALDVATVTRCDPDITTIGSIDYIAGVFEVDVIGSGT